MPPADFAQLKQMRAKESRVQPLTTPMKMDQALQSPRIVRSYTVYVLSQKLCVRAVVGAFWKNMLVWLVAVVAGTLRCSRVCHAH